MGGLSIFHWLIVLVIGAFCLAVPIVVVVLIVTLAGQRPSGPNLVYCPDCNRRVSRLAANCPHCGRPLAAQQTDATSRL